MTKHRAILKAIPAAILLCVSGFAAADTQNMAVSASISAKCKFDTTVAPTMAFGSIDPSGGSNVTATANIVYNCTNGTSPTSLAPTAGGLNRTMTDGGSNNLSYTLAFDPVVAGSGFSAGKAKTIEVTGTITPAQFNDAVAASYNETVGLTILP
jgi:spore coat protein U-like protein